MDKYVKLKDLETYAKIAKTMGAFDSSTENFLRNARFYATDKAVEVIRCKDCGKSIPNTGTGGFIWCDKYAEHVKVNGYCSDGIPKKGG